MIKQSLPAGVDKGTISGYRGEALADTVDQAPRPVRSTIDAEPCAPEVLGFEAPESPTRMARPDSYVDWQLDEMRDVQDRRTWSGYQSARVTERFAESARVRKFRPPRRGVFERTNVKHQPTRSLAR